MNSFTPRAAIVAVAIGCGLLAAGEKYWPAAFGVFAVAVLGWFTTRNRS